MTSFVLRVHRSLGLSLLPSNLACSALCGIRSIDILSRVQTIGVFAGRLCIAEMLPYPLADSDIWLGGLRIQTFCLGNVICFPVSHVYFFVGGEAKVYSQTRFGPWPDLSPGFSTVAT